MWNLIGAELKTRWVESCLLYFSISMIEKINNSNQVKSIVVYTDLTLATECLLSSEHKDGVIFA